jgi:hypothetical protein
MWALEEEGDNGKDGEQVNRDQGVELQGEA